MNPVLAITILLAAAPQPLPEAEAAIFRGSPQERLAKEACEGERRVTRICKDAVSFVFSNEMEHRIYRPHIDGVGGGYVGVGADHGLTFVAWARSELAWLMDYDLEVVRLNRIHLAFVRRAATRDGFRNLWRARNSERAQRVLDRAFGTSSAVHFEVWERNREAIFRHLMRRKRAGTDVPGHWLDEADSYAYVRAMALAKRIRVVKGDLLKRKALRGIGAAATELGVPIRVLYLSNAEEFWPYPRNFRDNIRSLPMDERSVVLRLRHNDEYAPRLDGNYSYAVHHGPAFQRDIADTKFGVVDNFLEQAQVTEAGLMLIDMPKPRAASATPALPEG